MIHGSVHGLVHGLVHSLVHSLVHGLVHGVLHNVLLEFDGLTCIFPVLRPFKTVLDNVLLEHGGLPCVLPSIVHPDLGHPPDTQGYLGLLSEPFDTTQAF